MLRLSRVLILSVLVVCVASTAFATTSRVKALAGASDYLNDDSNIFRWYGTLPSYTNMVMGEFGQAEAAGAPGGAGTSGVNVDYQALGFTHTWGENSGFGTWAIFLVHNSLEDDSFFIFDPLRKMGQLLNNASIGGPSGPIMTPTTKFILQWGKQFSDVFSLGLLYTRSDASLETTAAPGAVNDLNFNTFGAGARIELGDAAYGDVSLNFAFAGGDTLGGMDKSSGFNLAARVFWEFTDRATLVPVFDWNTADYAFKSTTAQDANGSSGDKWSDIKIGAALHYDVNTSNLLLFALEAEFITLEPSLVATGDQSKVSVTHLPKFFVALESDITSWLTTRVGATKTMRKTEVTEPNGDKITTTDPYNEQQEFSGGPTDLGIGTGNDFEFSLGVGFHLGDWDLDAVVANEAPFRLGYWLTGASSEDNDPFVTRISGTYRF